jgi:Spy/CpxP family protein refolding chaperone
MNRTLLAATLVLALSGGVAIAQQPAPAPDGQQPSPHQFHHRQPSPQREAEHLSKRLNLSPDQTAKLEPIFANRDQQMETIRSNGQLTQQDAHMQMRALMKTTNDQLSSVLTPDQMQQMRQMRRGPHGMHGQWQGGQQQAPPPPPPSGL